MNLKENFQNSTQAYFSVLIKKLFEKFDQYLFDQAEKAGSNKDQTRYFEAMKDFRQKSDEMASRYQAFLKQGIEDFYADREDTVEKFCYAPDELSLIDKDVLEDELAISIIASRASTQYAESLWKLNRRLAVIRGGKKADDETNPCGPSHLCNALQHAAKILDIDNAIKIQLYKFFGKVVMPRAGEYYEKANQHFVDSSILPNLQFEIAKAAAASQAQGTVPDVSAEQQTAEGGNAGYGLANPQQEMHQQELLSAIRALQSAEHQQGVRSETAGGADYGNIQIGGTSETNSVRAMDFAFALSAMQQKLHLAKTGFFNPAKPVETVENTFVEQLNKLSTGSGRNNITTDDADTIDLVGMLFKYVLDDPKLPDVVKSLLSHLHTPMLKVALIDKNFFAMSSHPARRLLNLLAEIGVRWVNPEKDDKVVFPKLRATVSRILEEFIDDLTIFKELLGELEEYAQTLEKRAELAEKRNTEAEKGLERLAQARSQAVAEIRKRMDGHQIPLPICELLEKPWTDFLAFHLLRHGDEGKTWVSAIKVVDGVIWSVEPKFSARDVDKFKALQEKLDKAIRQGLKAIGYDDQASKEVLHELKQAQELALEQVEQGVNNVVAEHEAAVKTDASVCNENIGVGDLEQTDRGRGDERDQLVAPQLIRRNNELKSQSSPVTEDGSERPEAVLDKQVAEADICDKAQASDKTTAITRQLARQKGSARVVDGELGEIHTQLKHVEFGTWFEFSDEDNNKSEMLKLAWFSSISDHYMFVNQAGMKSAVKTQLELAEGIHTGLIKIVKEQAKSFVERALESILGHLKPSAA